MSTGHKIESFGKRRSQWRGKKKVPPEMGAFSSLIWEGQVNGRLCHFWAGHCGFCKKAV